MRRVIYGDNLTVLRSLPDGSVPLIYIDPPFNTGRVQERARLRAVRAEDGDRIGFGGRRYRTSVLARQAFADAFDDYLGFLEPRLVQAYRVLAPNGSFYFHIDYREAHYCKVLLDGIFGRASFLNEIIWAYDYGARTSRRWPPKHDTILVYVKNPDDYVFNAEEVDREPYMAPGLVTPEKAARGKLPSDCFSADTDVLTERGWLSFPDLTLADRVASISPAGELSYASPAALHAHRYRGSMCAFVTRTVDLLVTPNHKMYVRRKNRPGYEFIEAHRLVAEGKTAGRTVYYALPNRVTWEGELERERFDVPACEYQRAYCAKPLPSFELGDWCEFIGLYVAAGSTTTYADRNEVMISQQKRENLPLIAELLLRMRLRSHYNGRGFVICSKQLVAYLRPFGKAHERRLPRDLLGLPRCYLERLYRGLMMGDGSKRRNEERYVTSSERLADDVQELMLKLGWSANITRRHDSAELHPNWRPKYTVGRRISRESMLFPDRHVTTVDYDGMVYCCTVEPHHTLVVRRNGKVAVCGNCWWHTIVSPTGKEKTGYPTQKPLGVLRRIVTASSHPGDLVLDFFAGSGTTGAAAVELGRDFLLVDDNEAAMVAMAERFAGTPGVEFVGFDASRSATNAGQVSAPADTDPPDASRRAPPRRRR